ncbi:spore germination protein, partial [Neobacillus niacini]|uniref:spore germination protein n=1 Tax=Neobacillus niacini TaxID=86668 RepID=UPI002FFFF449
MRKKISKLWKKSLNTEPEFNEQSNTEVIELKKQDISTSYDQNLATFKTLFTVPDNIDVKVREFTITSLKRKGFIIFLSTMTDIQAIMDSIEEPLIDNEHPSKKIPDIVSYPIASTASNIGEITEFITAGNTALFVDDDDQCYLFETTQIRGRPIEKSDNEVIVKGAKEAFN